MDKKIFGAIIASSMLFGIGVGGLATMSIQEAKEKRLERLKPGIHVNRPLTYNILVAIGMHALKDNLYDTYELNDILESVDLSKGG